ncbi:hypothetical protein [Microlunatus parietis]|uniref:Uncharacterized protein n=1 Tax=Microlunatus parietis TaxID=682979 RepID=A0A7Y9IFC3_9ACTN|nr:hypothetical protein [Microlunatus parietis]NYE75169.1 hypothetical protein [Microlunatus parietis]
MLIGDPRFEVRSYGGGSTVRTDCAPPGDAAWIDVPVDGGANGRTVDLIFTSGVSRFLFA